MYRVYFSFQILDNFRKITAALVTAAKASYQRRALVLSGDQNWCLQAAQASLEGASLERVPWISASAPEKVWKLEAAKAHQFLGQEVDALVFNAHSGFDLDAFGIITGAIRGGGLLLLLTPPLESWPSFPDPEHARIVTFPYRITDVTGRFIERLVRLIRGAEGMVFIEQEKGFPRVQQVTSANIRISDSPLADKEEDGECRTADQRRAVEAIVKVVTGQRRRPVVLTSDRGRGKSAALGIGAARLLQRGLKRIIVTGPRLDTVVPLFRHAQRLLPQASVSRTVLTLHGARLEFAAPDALIRTLQPADLLLVDEAAALPTPLLEQLLQRYPRIAFATTIHGYEGTGRGFALRFHKVLDERTRGWKALRLETPIRWRSGDPLEHFAFQALLLNAKAAPASAVALARPENTLVEQLDREVLVKDEATLSELFGLLVLAHYQTRPYDLRHLLDGPNLLVYVMRYRGHVVATALLALEGGFDEETARGIWEGCIRPHGHLLPESLAAHLGLAQAPRLRCARIMRIAVHPTVQNQGLGSQLVGILIKALSAENLDYLGSSFGATEELLRFWERLDFLPVRLSVKRGATSGAHSALVLYPLSNSGQALVKVARHRFQAHLPHQLSDPLRELEPPLAACFLRCGGQASPLSLDRQDWCDVLAFAFGRRMYEVCIAPIWKLACGALPVPESEALLREMERNALIVKVLQKRSWREAAAVLELSGRVQVIEALRQALRPLVLHFGSEAVRREAERLREH
ncbi:tRNA(Met)-cytidine N(4)-acetyltransferase [Nitrosococcus oceani ATCC 19707]|uniref:tRNA(Met) cytidine acetyltransferase TmcA n=2 Tax=Nitrosococcus oceani TaxID=1229 RepID=Q3J7N7_NITOC|nr:GNAT family N-acetyltransferase [Nitrosococcus oceani]ABA59159.1 tRNA(Met)-cytidine N(4)-acetyltransferase [Nitrosococcus oceani ATCC 19707]KFI18391.1 tRNA(Met) cytidine acetyltransferase [Nitrosococcus oceani C-27]